jgi:hypothetical protein
MRCVGIGLSRNRRIEMDIKKIRLELKQQILDVIEKRDKALNLLVPLYYELDGELITELRKAVYAYYDTSFQQRMLNELERMCEGVECSSS